MKITTIEMHTGGEPLRIITGGFPEVKGDTILDKRNYALHHLDVFRKLLIHEPRGHFDQYAALPVKPDLPDVDLAVLFLHNEGYSTMCGHAVIALARYSVDYGLVKRTLPETRVNIQCPCGLVVAYVECTLTSSGQVRFLSVPAFSMCRNISISVEGISSPVTVDVAYGGAFYALVEDNQLNMDLDTASSRDIADVAYRVTEATRAKVNLKHAADPRLEFLYGTIITRTSSRGVKGDWDGIILDGDTTSNVCVFANKEIDRSPTGSGVTARVAHDVATGNQAKHVTRRFRNALTGSEFTGRWAHEEEAPEQQQQDDAGRMITVEVKGHAFYTGTSEFTIEDGDTFQEGFLLR